MKQPIVLSFSESSLKKSLRRHLRKIGYTRNSAGELVPSDGSKESYRALHLNQRQGILRRESSFIKTSWSELGRFFASGEEINPTLIMPRLELIAPGTFQSDLFRLACLTWSIPVSAGYGRRLRFLVWDDHNGKLMGVIGLTDPVFNLRARDSFIGWSAKDREERLIYLLDAFALGAVSPYNMLLGGKLIACLVRSQEVIAAFNRKYSTCSSTISKNERPAHLVAVTTSSALGRSSVYNRLKLGGAVYFRSLGYTQGWGHFHVPDYLFTRMRTYLREKGDPYANNNRFGEGPSWRFRAIRQALTLLGLRPDLLKHGLAREVFICTMATNALEVLRGKRKLPRYGDLQEVEAIGALARDRWLVPRSERDQRYLTWRTDQLISTQLRDASLNVAEGSLYGASALRN